MFAGNAAHSWAGGTARDTPALTNMEEVLAGAIGHAEKPLPEVTQPQAPTAIAGSASAPLPLGSLTTASAGWATVTVPLIASAIEDAPAGRVGITEGEESGTEGADGSLSIAAEQTSGGPLLVGLLIACACLPCAVQVIRSLRSRRRRRALLKEAERWTGVAAGRKQMWSAGGGLTVTGDGGGTTERGRGKQGRKGGLGAAVSYAQWITATAGSVMAGLVRGSAVPHSVWGGDSSSEDGDEDTGRQENSDGEDRFGDDAPLRTSCEQAVGATTAVPRLQAHDHHLAQALQCEARRYPMDAMDSFLEEDRFGVILGGIGHNITSGPRRLTEDERDALRHDLYSRAVSPAQEWAASQLHRFNEAQVGVQSDCPCGPRPGGCHPSGSNSSGLRADSASAWPMTTPVPTQPNGTRAKLPVGKYSMAELEELEASLM